MLIFKVELINLSIFYINWYDNWVFNLKYEIPYKDYKNSSKIEPMKNLETDYSRRRRAYIEGMSMRKLLNNFPLQSFGYEMLNGK